MTKLMVVMLLLCLNQMLYVVIPLQLKLFLFARFSPPRRVECLAPRREIALSVFAKNTATCYRIGSRTKVSQPFDYHPGAQPTEKRRYHDNNNHLVCGRTYSIVYSITVKLSEKFSLRIIFT